MQDNKIKIRDIFINNVNLNEAVDTVIELSQNGSGNIVVTPNAEIAQECHENYELREIVNNAQLAVADGVGVVLASKILNKKLKGKVAGIDIAEGILPKMEEKGLSLYLFGGKPGIADEAEKKMLEKYPNLKICGKRNGYFTNDKDIIADINEKNPNVLFVCLGAPKQEIWMDKNKHIINAGVMLGLGGTLDGFAGTVKRAPEFFVKFGLEWFYRLIKEPKRIGRMMKLPKYLFSIIFFKLSGKNKEVKK